VIVIRFGGEHDRRVCWKWAPRQGWRVGPKIVNGWPAARPDELLPWASIYTMHAHDPRLAA